MGTIRAENITKLYPGTCALNNVSIEFESGKIHAFVGKNGSGKSTLLKIFAGAVQPTEGKVFLDGQEVDMKSPADATQKGIATVFQELSLVSGISVAENIFVGRLPRKKSGLVNWRRLYADAQELLDDLKIDINPKTLVEQLTVSQMQMVEIAKAMSFHPCVLQLDEPTSALSQTEAETLFRIMRNLKEKNVVIIFVTHRLQELWDVADTCLVLRDGVFVDKLILKDTDRKGVLDAMFGSVEALDRPNLKPGEETVLEVRNLKKLPKVFDVSFELKKGEVLGIAGMMGSGRTELLRAIWGADPFDAGELYCFGKKINHPTPPLMKKLGVGMIQEDRKRDGLIAAATVEMNCTYASIEKLGKGFMVDRKTSRRMFQKQKEALSIKVPSADTLMAALSGGNQQKIILGRLLNTDPQILLFDEPSRGIDVATKQQIFQIIWELARQGISSIVVSSELDELLEVCTRILIMRNGRLTGTLGADEASADKLYLRCMTD